MDTPHRLYVWITTTDIFTSVAMLPMCLSYQQGRAPVLFGDVGVCQVWGILWSVTGRLSVFLVAILSVTRCLHLTRPFVVIKTGMVMGIVTGYAVLQLFIATLPYFYLSIYEYDHISVTCLWAVARDISPAHNRAGFLALYICCVIIPTVIPVIPTIISCLSSVLALRRAGRSQSLLGAGRRGGLGAQRKNDWATNTIILTCLVYLACNVPFALYLFLEVLSITSHIHIIPVTTTTIYVRLFLGIFSVSVNAALNPVIYYYRFRAFKRYSEEFKKNVRNSVVENTQMVRSSVSAVIRRMSTAANPSVSVLESEVAMIPRSVGCEDVILEESENEDSLQNLDDTSCREENRDEKEFGIQDDSDAHDKYDGQGVCEIDQVSKDTVEKVCKIEDTFKVSDVTETCDESIIRSEVSSRIRKRRVGVSTVPFVKSITSAIKRMTTLPGHMEIAAEMESCQQMEETCDITEECMDVNDDDREDGDRCTVEESEYQIKFRRITPRKSQVYIDPMFQS